TLACRAQRAPPTHRDALRTTPPQRPDESGRRRLRGCGTVAAPAVIISFVDSLLSYARARQSEMAALIRQFVECESPSDDAAAVNRFVELVSDTLTPFGKVKTFGGHLVCEVQLPGRKKSGQVMALGHADTVWPVGTLRTMPFREADGRLW